MHAILHRKNNLYVIVNADESVISDPPLRTEIRAIPSKQSWREGMARGLGIDVMLTLAYHPHADFGGKPYLHPYWKPITHWYNLALFVDSRCKQNLDDKGYLFTRLHDKKIHLFNSGQYEMFKKPST